MQFSIEAFERLQTVRVDIEAVDAADARRQAEARGLSVLRVRAQGGAGAGQGGLGCLGVLSARWAGWRASAGRSPFPLLAFNQSLLILLQAGLSVVECIDTLAEREARPDTRRVLAAVRADLGEGRTLSQALERQPAVFPPLYVAGIRAHERSGGLTEAIARFIAYRQQTEQLRKRVVGAAIYPAMILGVGGLVIAFLLLYVVPRFSVVFQDMGDRIPALSRWLLAWGQFVHAHGGAVMAVLAAALAGAVWAGRQAPVRAALMRGLQRLPRVGEQMRVYQLARFYRALGLLLQAGIPVLQALDMVAGLLPASLQAGLAGTRREVAEGRAVSDAFEAQGLATVVALRLLRVAEQTGRMGDMLERSALFHEEDIAQAIDWFIKLFEPLLMVAIGLVIGVVVLLMYAPIFELAGSLQ